MNKRVLVIVVTYNGMQWLERCLRSVYSDADLYVFDNDSTDGSADFVATRFPKARLIRSAENVGFSITNNRGMQYAMDKGYDYVYLLNQDAWLDAGALEKLVAFAESHPEYGLLSPLQMKDGYHALDEQFAKCYRKRNLRRVMAAHWLLPTAAIRRVGLFNEELFPHWGQDDDWCNRLHFCGLKIGVVPMALAVHDRARRKETLETLVKRNYYTGSLVRLANPNRPFSLSFGYVLLFTLVKAVKYRSLLPFKYFREIIRQLPLAKISRTRMFSAQ